MYKKFAELLEKRKVTAYRVSKETGIPANTFTDWKNGRSKPKFDKLMALAKFFDVPVEYFHDEESRDTDKPQIRKGVQTMPHKIS